LIFSIISPQPRLDIAKKPFVRKIIFVYNTTSGKIQNHVTILKLDFIVDVEKIAALYQIRPQKTGGSIRKKPP
jgi:hypothetical protein